MMYLNAGDFLSDGSDFERDLIYERIKMVQRAKFLTFFITGLNSYSQPGRRSQ